MRKIKVITPTQTTQVLQATQALQPTQALVSTQPLKSTQSIQEQKQQQTSQKTFLSNYSDPTELNSFIDALTNREAVSKKFGEAWGTVSTLSGTVAVLSFAGSIIAAALAPVTGGASLAVAAPLAKIGAVAAIPSIPAAVDVTIEKGIKPIVAGKPKEAGLNMLMNLGETMDAVANPVKGLILEGPEGFAKGTGFASGGRVNYDYDTGFFLTDLLLEMVSDPLNWVDFGTSMALKSATKNVAEAMTKEISAQAVYTVNKTLAGTVGEITAEGAERISKQVSKTTSQVAREWASKGLNNLTEEARNKLLTEGRNRIQQTLVQAIKKELPDASATEIKAVLREIARSYRNGRFVRGALNQIQDFTFDTLSSDVIKGLAATQYYSDSFQKFLTKNAFRTSGYGIGIEIAKRGFKPIKEWASKTVLRKMKEAKVFNEKTGIDIRQWTKAKAIWEAGGAYVNSITKQVTERNLDTFYNCIAEQFVRDKQFIELTIRQYANKPVLQAAQLDAVFKTLYNCDYDEYLHTLKTINSLEKNIFDTYIQYVENIHKSVTNAAINVRLGKPIKKASALYTMSFEELNTKTVDTLTKLFSTKNAVDFTQTAYTLKISDDKVMEIFLSDNDINKAMSEFKNNGMVDVLEKIKNDSNALKETANAEQAMAVREVLRTYNAYKNAEQFYNTLARTVIPDIKHVSDTDFKRYIINELLGMANTKSTTELLANFDSKTMPELMERLRILLRDYTKERNVFEVKDYLGLEQIIGQVCREYLELQKNAGIENIRDLISNDFIKSLNKLVETMPDYTNELQVLTAVSPKIETIFSQVKATNEMLLGSILGNNKTIFDITNMRTITDLGYALNTVTTEKNIKLFAFPENIENHIFQAAETLGKNINNLKEDILQYRNAFDDKFVKQINDAYTKFTKIFLKNTNTDTPTKAFKYLLETTDPIEQYVQMTIFKQMIDKDITTRTIFNTRVLDSDYDLIYALTHPERFQTTDFAWDGMAQSAIVADKQFNEELINFGTRFKNLDLQSKAINFQEKRAIIEELGLNDPRAIRMERYVRKVDDANKFLTNVSKTYDDLFDKELAKSILENLRDLCNNFPEIDARWSSLIDDLEAYWQGNKTFQQSPKYLRNTPEFIDEFTPFWENIVEMNYDIQNILRVHNGNVAYGIIPNGKQYKLEFFTPWAPMKKQQEFNKLVDRATRQNALGTIQRLLNSSPEQFVQELACRHRFIVLFNDDLKDKYIATAFTNLKNSLDKDVVSFISDDNLQCQWIILNKTQKVSAQGRQFYLNGNPIIRMQNKATFEEFSVLDEFVKDTTKLDAVKTFNELDNTLESLTGAVLGDSQGEIFSKEMLEKIFDQMPEEAQKLFDTEELFDKQFFEAYLFNESVLGTPKSKRKLGLNSSNMVANYKNAITQSQYYTKAKTEYINTVFDNSLFGISGKNSIFKDYSNQDLLEALQANTDYKLVALVDDAKHGVKVREIRPTTVEAIAKARELNAVVVPLQVYKDMYNTVNHRIGSAGIAKLWSRIMYTYKFGYLCRPGAFIRNWVDTNLKSYFEMGDEYKSYMAQAHRLYDAYQDVLDKCQARIHDLTKQGVKAYDLPSLSDLYKEYFENVKPKYLDYETFLELKNNYFSQGVSDNIMREIYETNNITDGWQMFTHLTGKITDIGNRTENYNRLATYLYELDRGLDQTSALARLSKIHFDYSFKTKAEQLVDMVFPFTTFSLRNYSYWAEMLEKHPWLLRNYTHIMKPSWDFKDYTPEELARDKRIQAQILYGQVKLAEFEDKIITFKANPSVQDAIQMFSDPINNVYEKLAAPIAYPLSKVTGEYTSPLNMLPVIGPTVQSIKSFADNKPGISTSVFSVIPKRTQKTTNIKFANKNYSGINKFKDNQYRVPNYRKNVVYDAYATKGITKYRTNLYPVIDVYHDVKSKYTVDVYNKIKNKVQTDVYKGIRYSLRLDVNRWR